MKIESIIKRASGTEVVLDRTRYLFRPLDPADAQSPHVCDVHDEDHIATFLRISEGYREYEEGAEPAQLRVVAPAQPPARGRELPPIQAALEDEEADRDSAMEQQAEFLRQMAAANAENADAIRAANDKAYADALREAGVSADGFKPGAVPADEAVGGDGEGEDGHLTAERLAGESMESLRTMYEAFVGEAPNPKHTRDFLIKKILNAK